MKNPILPERNALVTHLNKMMIPKIRWTVLIVFLAFVKHIAPLKVYVLEDALQKRPSEQPTSIYLKPVVKSDPNLKNTICQKVGIICLAPIQNSKDVLRGGEDSEVKETKSSSYSEEHSDSISNDSDNENHLTIFDDLTRGSHEKAKTSVEDRHTLQIKPVKIEDTGLDINKLTKDRGYYIGSGRKLGKIVNKRPKVAKISTDSKESSDDESDDDDEEEEEKGPTKGKTDDEEESESGEDETNANDNASPETDEQDKTKKRPKKMTKVAEMAKKKKIEKKYQIPKRFEVVANGESEEPKKNTNKGKEQEDSDEKGDGKADDKSDESGNPAPEDIDLTDIVEKNSIETTTEKVVLVDMEDDKEKYTYIQGLHRKVQVGNKKESEEEDEEPPEKTAEEDIGLLYRRGSRLPYFLPKRYIWDEDDYKNLGYFWFNGPQGQSPGNYRIRYKK